MVRAPAPGTGGSRVRFLPGPRAGVARCNLHFKATCAEQLAQSKLHRATCADQLAPTSLRRAPCLEQLAQSNLRRATYAEQLAQSNLHRAPCLVLSRACFTNASCREKERILQRWADLACDVLLSGQPWSSFFRHPFSFLLASFISPTTLQNLIFSISSPHPFQKKIKNAKYIANNICHQKRTRTV